MKLFKGFECIISVVDGLDAHEIKLGLTQNPNCPHPPTPSPRTGEGE
jgi:hypothetical protein